MQELAKRGWTNKRWTRKDGITIGGRPFDKTTLFKTLTNVVYTGRVRYKEEIHPGEHTAIVDDSLFQRVQATLHRNGRTGGSQVRNRYGALLKGILRCGSCQCSMGHTYTSKGNKHYRYYVCLNAQKRGWGTCQTKSIPAGEIERFVVEQIREIGKDAKVLAETIRQAREQAEAHVDELKSEQASLQRELRRYQTELTKLAAKGHDPRNARRLAEVQDGIGAAELRATAIRQELLAAEKQVVDECDVTEALARFDPVWDELSPKEQARVIRLLVQQVNYNAEAGEVSVTFHPEGIRTLAREKQEVAA